MPFPFAAVAGAVLPGLVGGLIGKKENDASRSFAKKSQKKAIKVQKQQDVLNRKRQLADRADERIYAAKLTKEDRDYAKAVTADNRQYAEGLTGSDRAYAAKLSKLDRANYLADKAADLAAYKKDRAAMQKAANLRAEAAAESRSLDFSQLRDDAIKAGFNPLTALQFAQSYSREVDYHDVGAPYSGVGAGPTSASAGGSQSGATVSGQTFAAPAAPSAYSTVGSGYTGDSMPVFSSAPFIADAVSGGIETFFNAQSEADEQMYRDVVGQVARGQLARQAAAAIPRDFGFDLSKVRPYRPSYAASNGAGLDPMHGRPVEQVPVSDVPITGMYDLGDGNTARGLSQDVEWSEIAQMGNEVWLGANFAKDRMGGWWPYGPDPSEWASRYGDSKPYNSSPKGFSGPPAGARSTVLTGRRPVRQSLGAARIRGVYR